MISKAEKIYIFEEFRLEPDKRMLNRVNGSVEQIRLSNLPFQVLLHLIENRDRFVSRNELLDKFWNGRDVYDTALTKAVGAVRKALGEPSENPRFIETRWAEGYRFIGAVEEQPVYMEFERTREVKFVIEEEYNAESHETKSVPAALAGGLPAVDIQESKIGIQNKSQISDLKLQTAGSRFFTRRRAAAIVCFISATLIVCGLKYSLTQPVSTKPAPTNSIAVLPLKNLSGNTERDIFVDGMTESLISSLSKIKGLKVISRNSSFSFKDKPAKPHEISEQLGVATYLEGNFRESGDKIRVEVRLVNAESGEILWSADDYERRLGDVFEIQDDIARSVATELRLKLTTAEQERVVRRQTNNVEAYQNYVKGRYFWKKKTRDDLEKARRFFNAAIALDPNYALAYAGLADYYISGIWYADFPAEEASNKAEALIAKALELDDQSAEAHRLRAKLAERAWDWETCRREYQKAIEINPNDAYNWQAYAFVLRNFDRRFDEAVTAIERAAELDPLSPSINTDVGVMLTHAGRTDEAIAVFKKTLETEPQFFDAYWNLGLAYERKGMNREAAAAFIESERLKGTKEESLAAFRTAFEQGGMHAFWHQWLALLLEDANAKTIPSFILASFYARAGENEKALEWLEKSLAAHEPYLVNLKCDFALDSLRADARFTDLMRRAGLAR
ncbi:MAG TPA: tetratricopeptide repeat protein [Pyrinomonadaceae bacterium]|jgi:TolB-like protein/DNA-binding winged helix-turn-helix (wHTH) protein/Flp pilus assembly protein TadD